MTGPRFARRTDSNHAELRECIRDCAKAFPAMQIAWMDTSNLGGKVGDGIIQFWSDNGFETHLLEFKASKKKKLTVSQETNPLKLVRINCRADIFDLLEMNDWL
jgi:hypothetical protein